MAMFEARFAEGHNHVSAPNAKLALGRQQGQACSDSEMTDLTQVRGDKRLHRSETTSATLFRCMLDQLSYSVFLVDDCQRIEFANAAAGTLLGQGTVLTSREGKLRAVRPAMALALDNALRRAAAGEAPSDVAWAGLPLMGTDGTRAAAYVVPLQPHEDCDVALSGHCAVFVAQCDSKRPAVTEVIRKLFQLTPAEAKISMLIGHGEKPAEIAKRLQLSIHTVRTHLCRAFEKTESADQAGLADMIRKLSPPISL
jgi:DNA-binding CsgD family transcriptional regulator